MYTFSEYVLPQTFVRAYLLTFCSKKMQRKKKKKSRHQKQAQMGPQPAWPIHRQMRGQASRQKQGEKSLHCQTRMIRQMQAPHPLPG